MFGSIGSRIMVSAVAVCIHLAVLAGYWWGDAWRLYSISWSHQFTVIILLMLAISAVMPFIRHSQLCRSLLGVRLLLTILISIPFGTRPGSFGLVYAILTFEGFLYLQGGLELVPGILCLVLSGGLAYLRMPLWYKEAAPVDVGSLMIAWAQSILSGAIGFFLSRQDYLRRHELELLRDLRHTNTYLADTNVKLQSIAAESETATIIKERGRMTREIHDTIAYTMTNLLSLLDAYRERFQASGLRVPDEVNQARTLARDGLGDVRRVLSGLRQRFDQGYNGLGNVMRLVEVFEQAAGMRVTLNYGDAPQFPGEAEEAVLYRVVQEGLTNALRHGHATEVFVTFHRIGDGIELTIRDNGRGAVETTAGLGLLGIRERVEGMGGVVRTISQPGYGFTLVVWLPLREEGGTVEAAAAGDRGRSEAVSGELEDSD